MRLCPVFITFIQQHAASSAVFTLPTAPAAACQMCHPEQINSCERARVQECKTHYQCLATLCADRCKKEAKRAPVSDCVCVCVFDDCRKMNDDV